MLRGGVMKVQRNGAKTAQLGGSERMKWFQMFYTKETEEYYYLHYNEQSYIIRVLQGQSLHIHVIHLIRDIERELQKYIYQHQAKEMTKHNEFYPHTMQVIESYVRSNQDESTR